MTDRYDEAVEALGRVPAPDQWDEIQRRAHRPADEAWEEPGTSPFGNGHRHRWPLMAAAAAVLLLAMVGAVLVLVDEDGSNVETNSSPSASDGPTPTTRPDTTTSEPNTTTTEPTTPLLDPAGPADYATAVWQAWRAGDRDELSRRTNAAVVEFLLARAPNDVDPASEPQCEGAAGSTYCTWPLGDGVQLQLRVDNAGASTGEERAVTEAAFTPASPAISIWPAGPGGYTDEMAQNDQDDADVGGSAFLLSSESVISSYADAELGWNWDSIEMVPVEDGAYQLRNTTTGLLVEVLAEQPVRQGEGGIWVMTQAGVTGSGAVADPDDDAGSPPEATCADLQLASVNAPDDMDQAQQDPPAEDPRLPEAAWPEVIGMVASSTPERAVFVVNGFGYGEDGGFNVDGPGDQRSWVVHDGDQGIAELTMQLNQVDCDVTLFSFGLSRDELVQFVQGVGHAD